MSAKPLDLTRRRALTGLAALPLITGARADALVSPPAEDIALLGVVAEAMREMAQSDALMAPWQDGSAGAEPDEVWEASGTHLRRFMRLRSEAALMPANTMAGVQAKARLALVGEPQQPTLLADPASPEAVVWSLCRDLLAMTGGVA